MTVNGVSCPKGSMNAVTDGNGNSQITLNCPGLFGSTDPDPNPNPGPDPDPDPEPELPSSYPLLPKMSTIRLSRNQTLNYTMVVPQGASRVTFTWRSMNRGEKVRQVVFQGNEQKHNAVIRGNTKKSARLEPGAYNYRLINMSDRTLVAFLEWQTR